MRGAILGRQLFHVVLHRERLMMQSSGGGWKIFSSLDESSTTKEWELYQQGLDMGIAFGRLYWNDTVAV
jgi:hypothetical protein